jgi:chromate transporter
MAGYFELFWSFFKIGSFTLGGGFAMIPLMEKELVQQKRWLSKEEFLDLLSISQAMPGVFAVNMATSIGYRLRGKTGAVMSVLGNILVPILTILVLAMFFRYFRDNAVVESIFKGIRPCVVALIAAPVFTMAKNAGLSWRNCWIPLVAAALIWLLGVSPVLIIIIAGIGGFVYGRIKDKKEAAA